MPTLGKLYRRFYPAMRAWGQDIAPPFGTVFGANEPEKFLSIYHAARQSQKRAIAFHLEPLVSEEDLNKATRIGNTLICTASVKGDDPAKLSHVFWHLSFQRGAVLPDCGIYFAERRHALVTRQEEKKICSNPAEYVLCAAALELMEGCGDGI